MCLDIFLAIGTQIHVVKDNPLGYLNIISGFIIAIIKKAFYLHNTR